MWHELGDQLKAVAICCGPLRWTHEDQEEGLQQRRQRALAFPACAVAPSTERTCHLVVWAMSVGLVSLVTPYPIFPSLQWVHGLGGPEDVSWASSFRPTQQGEKGPWASPSSASSPPHPQSLSGHPADFFQKSQAALPEVGKIPKPSSKCLPPTSSPSPPASPPTPTTGPPLRAERVRKTTSADSDLRPANWKWAGQGRQSSPGSPPDSLPHLPSASLASSMGRPCRPSRGTASLCSVISRASRRC